jgi:hypothetical protein
MFSLNKIFFLESMSFQGKSYFNEIEVDEG